jgi:hypothetical protein
MGEQRGKDMGGSPLTQLVVETNNGSVFLVRETQASGLAVLATGKKDSRVGLVFYDMKTCIRDTQEPQEPYPDVAAATESATEETGTGSPGGEMSVGPETATAAGGAGEASSDARGRSDEEVSGI